ncbi:hypothetical protein HPB48_013958 [Haemaphysalis longicornis]|uniref:FHA domain-containing protein n=1 Tax=Haemaphysalis longicornis TaxID=44386 RepID=A0A9J6H4S2_HAELO|nr:hypothetical protein HPB48_013958 [Haemaphysalis longicornis]
MKLIHGGIGGGHFIGAKCEEGRGVPLRPGGLVTELTPDPGEGLDGPLLQEGKERGVRECGQEDTKHQGGVHTRRGSPHHRGRRRRHSGDGEKHKWGKPEVKEEPEEKASGGEAKLWAVGQAGRGHHVYNGWVIKYNEPRRPQAQAPLAPLPFKGDNSLPFIPLHRQSAYLLGSEGALSLSSLLSLSLSLSLSLLSLSSLSLSLTRLLSLSHTHTHTQGCRCACSFFLLSFFLPGPNVNSKSRLIADIPIDHPSCSKQHAVLQFRLVAYTRDDGTTGRRVRPYVIDLESSNGTFVNNQRIEPRRYVELLERDVLKFVFSTREYVICTRSRTRRNLDDDVALAPGRRGRSRCTRGGNHPHSLTESSSLSSGPSEVPALLPASSLLGPSEAPAVVREEQFEMSC